MADNIRIKFPDGSTKEVPKGTTALEVAKSISPRWRGVSRSPTFFCGKRSVHYTRPRQYPGLRRA
jgi:TGS domain